MTFSFFGLTCSQSDRKILWLWEESGHTGKTFLAKWLRVWRGAYCVTGGKYNDIRYAYNYQRYVVFDLARDLAERCPYHLMEEFKNGFFFSGKYQSNERSFRPARVVVMANFGPDMSKLSADRWDIRYVGAGGPPGLGRARGAADAAPLDPVHELDRAPPAGELGIVIPSINDIE